MDTYRDDYGAAREHADALKGELEETKRSLEEARTLAKLHEETARTLAGS
jgi:hypothetical protein